MTKTTSRAKAVILKAASLPVICGILYLICTESVAKIKESGIQKQTTVKQTNIIGKETDEDKRRDTYYAGVRIIITDKSEDLKIDEPYEKLTLEQKRKYLFLLPKVKVKKTPSAKEFEDYKNKSKYAIWVDDKNVNNTVLNKYTAADIAYVTGSSVYKNARSKQHPQPFQYNLYTHAYFDSHLKNSHLKYMGDTYNITINESKKDRFSQIISNP